VAPAARQLGRPALHVDGWLWLEDRGGVQGGISNGEEIYFRVAFKPTATILRPQATVDVRGRAAELHSRGRHDPCVLPRAVPIVEAMAALVLVDHWMRQGAQNQTFKF
jgi:chorismate synthase